jgi:signal transduction histidine kinase
MHVAPFESPKAPSVLRDQRFVEVLVFVAVQSVLLVAAWHETRYAPDWFLETACNTIVALTLVLAAVRYAKDAHVAYEELSAAHAELRVQVDRVSKLAALRERGRIAREVHEALGHELTSLAMQIEVGRRLVGPELPAGDIWANHPANVHLSRAHVMALQILGDVRRRAKVTR